MTTALDYDVVVVGGGVGGMTVATLCARAGLTVAVLESGPAIGGSALMSEGYVWTLPDSESFRLDDPLGDVAKYDAMRREMPAVFSWLEELGVYVGPELPVVSGSGRQMDVVSFFAKTKRFLERHDGNVFVNVDVTRLLCDDDGVVGAVAVDRTSGDAVEIRSEATVIATGGFHASSERRERYGVPSASSLVVRGNSLNTGGGLQLGLDVGAAVSSGAAGFYGHPVPYPMSGMRREDYTLLVQYQVTHGVLLDHRGRRFCDEARGYSHAAQEIARQGTALLLVDEWVLREHVLRAYLPGMEDNVDKMAEAGRRGAHYARGSLSEVAAHFAAYGYSAEGIVEGVSGFNLGCESGDIKRRPLDEEPLSALEVQASITFGFGGLDSDVDGRVLRPDGRPIARLFAAGVDAGGLNVQGYAGGLIRGLALGRRTARQIAAMRTKGA